MVSASRQRAARPAPLNLAVLVQRLDDRPDLFANRRAEDRVASIETLGRDHAARRERQPMPF
jgi:hypothetical protein